MKIVLSYIKTALYNIKRNKAYAIFYILGTTLAFVFIAIILHVVKLITTDAEPMLYGDRIVTVSGSQLYNMQGQYIGGIYPMEMEQFFAALKGYEMVSYDNDESSIVYMNDQLKAVDVSFIGGDYFKMYQYRFIDGTSFDREDAREGKKVAVIKESLARVGFPGGKAVGEKIKIQGIEYEVIGVVADYSMFSAPTLASVWIPYRYNKFIPSAHFCYNVNILFPEDMDVTQMKELVCNNVRATVENRGMTVDILPEKIYTKKEERIREYGTNIMLYGAGAAIFLLLIIPALNIVTLNFSNMESRASEIAISRAIGATRISVFFQIMGENFFLVLIGAILGVLLVLLMSYGVQSLVLGGSLNEKMLLIASLDMSVIWCQVLPLAILFSLLSGGLPAYLITRKNIAEVLKGGNE